MGPGCTRRLRLMMPIMPISAPFHFEVHFSRAEEPYKATAEISSEFHEVAVTPRQDIVHSEGTHPFIRSKVKASKLCVRANDLSDYVAM